jgi:hypothetical protein
MESSGMGTDGKDLIEAMEQALAHAKGDGPAILHTPADRAAVRLRGAAHVDLSTDEIIALTHNLPGR